MADRVRHDKKYRHGTCLKGDSKGGKPLAHWAFLAKVKRSVKKMP